MKGKTLIFIRHAKSSWAHEASDIDRPLKEKGKKDADIISRNFIDKNYVIDFIYSSPAKRAYSTCKIFQKNLNWSDNKVSVINQLYDFSGESVLHFINNLDDKLDTVAIFGHNYAFTSLINLMGDKNLDNFPTSGLAVLKFDIESWKFAKYGQTELFMFPRDFRP